MNNPVDVQPRQNPRSYHIVIKAVGSRCNLDCGYCYYLGKEKVVPTVEQGRMSEEVLEEFIRQYVAGQDAETIIFTWHGGEPALLGLDFYRKVVALQKKYANGNASRTTSRPTARCWTIRGASSSRNTTFWWA